MNPQQRIEWVKRLRAVGIPWRSFPAVGKCALKINAGETYLVAAQYAEALVKSETYPSAVQSALNWRARLGRYYLQHKHEAR